MSDPSDPYAKLARAASQYVYDTILGDLPDETAGDSPIEKLLSAALLAHVRFGDSVFLWLRMLAPDQLPPDDLQDAGLHLYLRPQVRMPGRRVDFILYTYDREPRILKRPGWRSLIIECDGHDFHERTKIQAKRDRSRDRENTKAKQDFMRFTGSELWADPWRCAADVIEWAEGSFA